MWSWQNGNLKIYVLPSRWNVKLMKRPVAKMTKCQSGKLSKWQVDKMACWKNGKLTKWQVDKMASWQNGKLTKWQVDKMASWRVCKLTKWQVDKLTSLPNFNLMNCQVDEKTNWQNGKFLKWQVDKTAWRKAQIFIIFTVYVALGQFLHFSIEFLKTKEVLIQDTILAYTWQYLVIPYLIL